MTTLDPVWMLCGALIFSALLVSSSINRASSEMRQTRDALSTFLRELSEATRALSSTADSIRKSYNYALNQATREERALQGDWLANLMRGMQTEADDDQPE